MKPALRAKDNNGIGVGNKYFHLMPNNTFHLKGDPNYFKCIHVMCKVSKHVGEYPTLDEYIGYEIQRGLPLT